MDRFSSVYFLISVAAAVVVASPNPLAQNALHDLKIENSASSMKAILRLARNVDSQEKEMGFFGNLVCSTTHDCWHNKLMGFMTEILNFNLTGFTINLARHCSQDYASICKDDDCPVTSMRELVVIALKVKQWACEREKDFQNSALCWEYPFRTAMSYCEETATENARTSSDFILILRSCFAVMVQRLPNCTPEDQDLLIDFSDFVIEEYLRYYKGYI